MYPLKYQFQAQIGLSSRLKFAEVKASAEDVGKPFHTGIVRQQKLTWAVLLLQDLACSKHEMCMQHVEEVI